MAPQLDKGYAKTQRNHMATEWHTTNKRERKDFGRLLRIFAFFLILGAVTELYLLCR